MPAIHVLDKSVAELIAAGEVVERPASVVKELIENSIDAGATSIAVEIAGGGIRMMRVSDNGCGISREDIPKAFLRHATSKVENADDLDGILTLGFRGEALASISAVCRVELATKTEDETEGMVYTVEGGEYVDCAPAGLPTGTSVTVRDIFFNTPARLKFLKKDISEGNSVAQVVDKCALSHPEIAFKFIRDGAVKLKTSGGGELLPVIYAIYDRDFADEMLKVDYVYENFARVSGYISKPSGVKPSRAYQTFFINGRFVKTRTAAAALEEAYKNKIMGGKFPACVLNLELDAAAVDVNVHPAKTEVRFSNEKPVFSSVYCAVKSALSSLEQPVTGAMPVARGGVTPAQRPATSRPEPERLSAREFRALFAEEKPEPAPSLFSKPLAFHAPDINIHVDEAPHSRIYGRNATTAPPKNGSPTDSAKITLKQNATIFEEPATNGEIFTTTITSGDEAAADVAGNPPESILIGEAFGTYILLENGDELLLVDKHAAHERLLYERIKRDAARGDRQVLLTPQTVALSRDEHAALIENLDEAEKLGFLAEDFGGGAVVVREVPIELSEADVAFVLRELADKLKNNRRDLTPQILDRLYYSIACRSAVKAHDKTSEDELVSLVRQLNENPSVTHCPHGRPVFIRLTRREVEKMFGRLG